MLYTNSKGDAKIFLKAELRSGDTKHLHKKGGLALEVDLQDQTGRDPFEEEYLILFGNDGASHHLPSLQFLTMALALQPRVEHTF